MLLTVESRRLAPFSRGMEPNGCERYSVGEGWADVKWRVADLQIDLAATDLVIAATVPALARA